MIIEEIMNDHVVTLTADDKIKKAYELIYYHNIRHIPIINDKREIVGIVSDRDVRDASPSIFHSNDHLEDFLKPISTIMNQDVITGHPLDFVEEVSTILYERNIGCLPIVSDHQLVGIVTKTDLLNTFVQIMGAHQPSSRIEVRVKNKAGVLAEVAAVFKKCKVNISSVFVHPEKTELNKTLVFRIQTMNPTTVIEELKKEGYEVLWPNLSGVMR
jgi:acetoin utilization protein AcuB